MKRLGLLAVVLAVVLGGTAAWAEGEFYVIAGGRGVGTRITSVPYEIKDPGFYYLGGDITTIMSTGNAIAITANHVTLDLMGFRLFNNLGFIGSANGIYMSKRTNVEIRNGTVCGFKRGIYEDDFNSAYHRVCNVRAIANERGIWLEGKNHLVNACTSSNGTDGIYVYAGMISGCVACGNYNFGILFNGPGSVIGNIANDNTTVNFGFTNTNDILVDRNSAAGLPLNYAGVGGKVVMGVNAGTP